MQKNIVTVLGGTGFLGREVVKHLAASGFIVNVVSRTPTQAGDLKVLGPVGKVVLSKGNIRNINSIKPYLLNNFAVIDLVGILYEKGRQKFSVLQSKAAGELAAAASQAGAEKFIYVSALGVDKAIGSKYARSKIAGENAVLEAFPNAKIIRPSLIFGGNGGFFYKFGHLAWLSPLLPLIGGGKTLFQPVYGGDIGAAIVKILKDPDNKSKTYELGGPKIYSFKELLQLIMAEIGLKRSLIPVPFFIAYIKAFFLQLLPVPLLTIDQVKLLKYNNVVTGENGFAELGITPRHLETMLPDILQRFTKK